VTVNLLQLAPALGVARLTPADWALLAAGPVPPLGGLGYGPLIDGADTVRGQVLSADGPMVDAWTSAGPVKRGQTGRVRWRHNGHWLYGAIELDETVEGKDLASLSRQAYADIFATLKETGCSHLQRLWNYLPGINADGGGLERYRQFNSGRQIAFLDAGYAAFEGAPAACAIGTRGGPFCVRFLAGTAPPVPVENPRQVSAYHYPSTYGPRAPTFSRAALVPVCDGQVALLISGTASIVGHASVHAGDVQAQTRETVTNLQAVIGTAHERCSARFDLARLECVVYVRHAGQAPLIRAVFEAAVGADSPAARSAIYLEADICRSDLLVEIEAHGVAEGEVRA
jgi:enamine deaminase RidA (YjgF/YER057c/UK114 family)